MYTRYYDGYAKTKDDKGEIVIPQNINNAPENLPMPKEENDEKEISITSAKTRTSLFNGSVELDDLILIAVLIFLLTDKDSADEDNNIFMLLIVGFILFSDIL